MLGEYYLACTIRQQLHVVQRTSAAKVMARITEMLVNDTSVCMNALAKVQSNSS